MLGERVKPRKGYGKVITKLELLHGRARDAQRRRGRRMTRHEVGRRWCPPPPPFTIIYHHTYLSIDGVGIHSLFNYSPTISQGGKCMGTSIK